MAKKDIKNNPHFVTSHDFHGDAEYIAWLQEIKRRYQRIRSRIALQANYGTLEFNWLLGRNLVEKKAEQRWGADVVEQLSLDMRAEYPEIKDFSSRNLWYMKQWYLFYCGDALRQEKLHQLGAELQAVENRDPDGRCHLPGHQGYRQTAKRGSSPRANQTVRGSVRAGGWK
ncbi:MAG: hypothetical protein IJP70_02155 [Bacteroidales bacterium]|nr:hypothetical protein [Bacteroidales bacterium]